MYDYFDCYNTIVLWCLTPLSTTFQLLVYHSGQYDKFDCYNTIYGVRISDNFVTR